MDKDKKLNTINYIYDDIKKVVNSCVIKYKNRADAQETVSSIRNFDHYYIASQEIDTFDSYSSFPRTVIRRAGVLDEAKIIAYSNNKSLIPHELKYRILVENRKYIKENYVETNNYYRELIGLPDVLDKNYIYLKPELCKEYKLDPNKPLHEYEDDEIAIISSHLPDIIAAHPDKGYLKYLGPYKVDLIHARTAKNFDIIKADIDSSHMVFLKSFFSTYNMCREYFTAVIYVKEKYNTDPLYDSFIAMSIMLMCIQRMMVNTFKLGVELDFYDLHSIQRFFDSYGVPFFEILPLDYQRSIMKNVNRLLRMKSTDNCLCDLASLLFLDRVTIVKYYLMKEQKYDKDDQPLEIFREFYDEDDEVILKEDVHNMYDLYFQMVDIKERNINLALEESSSRVDYYETIEDDPYWWDDDDVLTVLTDKEFNYIDTKYMGLNIMYNLTDLMFESVYFLNMLVDKKNEIYRPQLNFFLTVKLPRITTRDVSVFDAVILLCALLCKKNHFAGNIIKTGTKILSVMGFDFEENLTLIRDEIRLNKKIYDQNILKFIKNMNIHSKDDVNNLYNNLVGFADYCVTKMNNTSDIRVYQAYKKLYDALMVKNYTTKILRKSDGEIADTYLDYLQDQQPDLAEVVENCSTDQAGVFIEHILATLNELIPDLEYLSSVNGTDNVMVRALIKLIEFFKSYTVELKHVNIHYMFDSKRYNVIRMIADPRFLVTFENRERVAYYLDSLSIHNESFVDDFIKPVNKIYIHCKFMYENHFDEKYHEEVMMNIKAIYEDIMRMIYSDHINSLYNNIEPKFKLNIEDLFMNYIRLFIDENSDSGFDINDSIESMQTNMVEEEMYRIRYSDLIFRLINKYELKYNMNLDDRSKYHIGIQVSDLIKHITEYSFIEDNIEMQDRMYMRYSDMIDIARIIIEQGKTIPLEERNKYHINIINCEKCKLDNITEFKSSQLYRDCVEVIYVDLINFIISDRIDENIDINDDFTTESEFTDNEIIKIKENIRIYYENEDGNI